MILLDDSIRFRPNYVILVRSLCKSRAKKSIAPQFKEENWKMNVPVLILCLFVVILEHFQRWNDAPCHRLLLTVNGSNRDLFEEIQLYPCFLKQHHARTLQPTNADHSHQLISSGSNKRKMSIKLVPKVLSFTNMAAGIEKTLGTMLNVIASRFWIDHF